MPLREDSPDATPKQQTQIALGRESMESGLSHIEAVLRRSSTASAAALPQLKKVYPSLQHLWIAEKPWDYCLSLHGSLEMHKAHLLSELIAMYWLP